VSIRTRIILFILPISIVVTFLVAYIPVELGRRTVGKTMEDLPRLVADVAEMKKEVAKTQDVVLKQIISIIERLTKATPSRFMRRKLVYPSIPE